MWTPTERYRTRGPHFAELIQKKSHHFPIISRPYHMWMNPKAILSSSISEPWPLLAPWPTASARASASATAKHKGATDGERHWEKTWRLRENTLENWEFWGIIENRMVVALCYLLPNPIWMVYHHNKRSSYGKSPLSMRISSITNINIIKDLQISDVPVWVYCHVWVPEGPGCGMAGTPPSSDSWNGWKSHLSISGRLMYRKKT